MLTGYIHNVLFHDSEARNVGLLPVPWTLPS